MSMMALGYLEQRSAWGHGDSLSVHTCSQGPTESPKLSPRSSRNPWVVLKHPDICSNLIPDVQRESCAKVISCSKH